MKSSNDPLDRLLRSAAAAPGRAPGEAPFPLEARVLASWRAQASDNTADFLVPWFRRAALCSCVLALASLAFTYHGRVNSSGGEMAVADSAMNMGVEP
jgi:hypothetical protein